jgi:exopolysaccharide biosynthesis polyprenyl glycosylphosphotransferase
MLTMFAGEHRRQKAVFASVDAVAVLSAFGIGSVVERWTHPAHLHANTDLLLVGAGGLAAIWIWVFHAFDLYRFRNGGLSELFGVIKASAFAAALTLLLSYSGHHYVHRLVMTIGFLLSIVFVMLARKQIRGCLRWLYTDSKIAIPVVIADFNPLAQHLCEQISDDLTQYELLGFLDDAAPAGTHYHGYPVMGRISELGGLAARYPGLELIVAKPDQSLESQKELVRLCEVNHVQWHVVPPLFCSLPDALHVDLAGGVPLIGPASCNIEGLNFATKRLFDLIAAAAILLVAIPLLLVVAIAIWISDGRPIFFSQKRVGIRGEPFELLKFRTMRTGASDHAHREYVERWIGQNRHAAQLNGQQVFKLIDDPRITRIGKVLRSLAIDELPQLINVLRGEMSLVGPRPALPYEVELYKDWHKRRLDALPGITGLWQVNGRNRLGFDEMVRLDLEYLNSWSLASDLKILFRTIPALIQGQGH